MQQKLLPAALTVHQYWTLSYRSAFLPCAWRTCQLRLGTRFTWVLSPRKVEPCEGGGYKDNETGEMLSQDDEADFMLYQQRLCDRYRVGEMADRLLQIVDCCMPRVADENRAYVMRCPNQVQTMLKKDQKQERKRCKKADASASPKHDNRAKRQAVEGERMQNMEGKGLLCIGKRLRRHATRLGRATTAPRTA